VARLEQDAIEALVHGYHGNPRQILGSHQDGSRSIIRAFQPFAADVVLLISADGTRHPMTRIDPSGLFEVSLNAHAQDPEAYQFHITFDDGSESTVADAYAFDLSITPYDLHLFGEGRNFDIYRKLGAHPATVGTVQGTRFAVWAPNAERVSVIGDFNRWDDRVHPMNPHPSGGVWELFIPGITTGAIYKYSVKSRFAGYKVTKADPYAFQAELRPRTGSVVTELDGYTWADQAWMESRAQKNGLNAPVHIYEVHLGSWRRNEDDSYLSYEQAADQLVDYVSQMGYTHIELMPVMEHPLDASWGYQVTGYYAATSRYGHPHGLMRLIDRAHQAGIGVILDWVPAHFPKDDVGLPYFDGTHLYEHADPRLGEHPQWGTLIFNFGRNEVRNFLIANALFWLREYHIDGLRVDAVSSMLYLDFGRQEGEYLLNEYGTNENLPAVRFLQEANAVIHEHAPGTVTIAEESTAWPMVSRPTYLGGLGFTYKWNMGWMHDTLKYMQDDPVYRRWAHNRITFALMYAFSENFILSFSHDEVVHGKGSMISKMAGDWWQKFASLRLLWGYQMTHPGKKLSFMGQEIGQWQEWSEARALDWHLLDFPTHASLSRWVHDLNAFYLSQPALYEHDFDPAGFRWIEANDADQSVYSYVRYADNPDDFIVVIGNFTPIVRYDYLIGVPAPGFYRETLNSDSEYYGGSNVGNAGGAQSVPVAMHGFEQSIRLTLPPLGIVLLKTAAQ
jgi:1,4-alpha-glucan branching enzyme